MPFFATMTVKMGFMPNSFNLRRSPPYLPRSPMSILPLLKHGARDLIFTENTTLVLDFSITIFTVFDDTPCIPMYFIIQGNQC